MPTIESKVVRDCLRALRQAGCAVRRDHGLCMVTLPDGVWREFPIWRFDLICLRTYQEVEEPRNSDAPLARGEGG